MLRRATALNMRTGTFSSPKLMVPLQIALAIGLRSFPWAPYPDSFKQTRPLNRGGHSERHLAHPPMRDHAAVLFELREVGVDRGGRAVLDSFSAEVLEGSTAIVGPSGAGKSTLLRLLNRLADPDRGGIAYRGRPLDSY